MLDDDERSHWLPIWWPFLEWSIKYSQPILCTCRNTLLLDRFSWNNPACRCSMIFLSTQLNMKDAKNRNLHRFVHFFPIRTNLLILEAGFHQIQWEDAWYTNYSSNTTVYDFWKQTENKWSNMLWDLDRLENRTRFNWKYNNILFSNNNLRELFGLWSLNGWCCFRCHFESGCCIRKQKHRNVYLKAQINEMTLNNNKIHVLNPPRYDIVNGSVERSAQRNLSNAKKL